MRSHHALAVAVLATGCHAGLSYSSEWSALHSKNGVDTAGGDVDAAPDYSGSLRTNVITISDDTGWLRAAAMAAASASEEATRRQTEANNNGGYYHREDISVPPVVPGGRTRVAVGWGSSDKWKQRFMSYTDSIEPRPIGTSGLYWSVEADVVFGTLVHMEWDDNSQYQFRAQVGPVFGKRIGEVGGFELSGHVGALIDPIFKPCAGLAFDDVPMLDITTYLSVDAIAFGRVTVGGRVAYDRGQMLVPSSAATVTATAGVVF